jgi:hypothetical protein
VLRALREPGEQQSSSLEAPASRVKAERSTILLSDEGASGNAPN